MIANDGQTEVRRYIFHMEEKIEIALVSQTLQAGDKENNLSKMEQVVAAKDSIGVNLFVFPENNIAGGLWKDGETDYRNLAEKAPEGPSCQRVIKLAQKNKTNICAGIIEKKNKDYFITHFLCNAKGFIGCQRKLFPQNPIKKNFFASGERLRTFELFGHKCAILACADFMFPETTILAGLAGVSLIISPTDCMDEKNKETMIKLLCAKAMGANVASVVAFGNDTKESLGTVLAGIAVDANGDVLACETGSTDQDKLVKVSLTLQKPKEIWGGFPARCSLLLRHLLEYRKNGEI